MSATGDLQSAALTNQGFLGTPNEQLWQWCGANGATNGTLTERMWTLAGLIGGTGTDYNERWYTALDALGIPGGSIGEKWANFWASGGTLGFILSEWREDAFLRSNDDIAASSEVTATAVIQPNSPSTASFIFRFTVQQNGTELCCSMQVSAIGNLLVKLSSDGLSNDIVNASYAGAVPLDGEAHILQFAYDANANVFQVVRDQETVIFDGAPTAALPVAASSGHTIGADFRSGGSEFYRGLLGAVWVAGNYYDIVNEKIGLSPPGGADVWTQWSGDPTQYNFRQSGNGRTYTNKGKRDYPLYDDRLAHSPITLIAAPDFNDWTLSVDANGGGGTPLPTVGEHPADWPQAYGVQSFNICNSLTQTNPDNIFDVWTADQTRTFFFGTTDPNEPLHVMFQANDLGSAGNGWFEIDFYDAFVSANYSTFRFGFSGSSTMNNGPMSFCVLPELIPLAGATPDVLPYWALGRDQWIVNAGTGWNPANGCGRITMRWSGMNGQWRHDLPNGTSQRKLSFQGIAKGYGHTPCLVLNFDDGNNTLIQTDILYLGQTTAEQIATLGLPHHNSLITEKIGTTGKLTLGEIAALDAAVDGRPIPDEDKLDHIWEWSMHDTNPQASPQTIQVNFTNGNQLPALGEVISDGNSTATRYVQFAVIDGNGDGYWYGGTSSNTGGSAGNVDWQDGAQTGDQGFVCDNSEVQSVVSVEAYEGRYKYNREYMQTVLPANNIERAHVIDDGYVYPLGSYRNGDAEQNANLKTAMLNAGMNWGRSTEGWDNNMRGMLTDSDVLGWEQLAFRGLSIETYDFFKSQSDFENYMINNLEKGGGAGFGFFHSATTDDSGSQSNNSLIFITLLGQIYDSIAVARNENRIKVLHLSKWRSEARRIGQMVVTDNVPDNQIRKV